ncbi:flavin reductase family protein [Paraliobacillus sp. X-1268]|uniref:flavin reductase family protein n=1 Tax=Paraliobacillus sp. X-1268 TaxID=2213193 RepID=UPI000E3EAB2F|nr:flavin reductase family protein [Paraliobacillus sp. X-1268]
MLSIEPSENSERDNYKFLIGSVIPRPIAFVTTKAKDGTLNGAPFSYFNAVTANPPLVSISLQRGAKGVRKDTARNISELGEFVVHIVDQENVDQINQTAASLPPNQSEIELANLTEIESTKISVPGVKEAKIRMECVLEQVIELGDKESTCDLVIGRVVQFHIDEAIYQDGRIDPHGLGAVSRLAGNDYAKIGEIFTIERPK